jgi:hypothetical protein
VLTWPNNEDVGIGRHNPFGASPVSDEAGRQTLFLNAAVQRIL